MGAEVNREVFLIHGHELGCTNLPEVTASPASWGDGSDAVTLQPQAIMRPALSPLMRQLQLCAH